MISVGIIGGSGYTGKKLLQFCANHPYINDYKVYGNKTAGQNLTQIFPDLVDQINDSQIASAENISADHDVYFVALPHGEALNIIPALFHAGKNIIDLGGDFRLDSKDEYEKWYKIEHHYESLLSEKVYGLADYHTTDYTNKTFVANPGCYPTATLLSILPLAENFGGEILSVSTIAYSGTSGAGKTPKQELLMSEMDGNVAAYKINNHRHQPEILQTLNKHGFNAPFSFTTHLLPVAVGIYATTSVHLKSPVRENELKDIYESVYHSSSFVRLRDVPPNLNWVVNTNYCDINLSVKDNVLIITSAIDNLIKGASGQAFQNMNKLYGWDESLGLKNQGVKNVSVY